MRKYLSYANVVATFALLFAMSGSALAAKHYLLNSVSQINPRVLAKLRATTKPQTNTTPPTIKYALISSSGEVVLSSPNVTATVKSESAYFVNFHQTITNCTTTVSEANLPGRWPGGYLPESAKGAASAWIPAGGGTGELLPGLGAGFPSGETAEVSTQGRTGADEKSAFSIVLVC